MNVNDDLEKLIEKLPFFLHYHLNTHIYKDQIIEIVLDLGRRPEARFRSGPEYLSQKLISWQDLDYTTKRISKFSTENRAGIEKTTRPGEWLVHPAAHPGAIRHCVQHPCRGRHGWLGCESA